MLYVWIENGVIVGTDNPDYIPKGIEYFIFEDLSVNDIVSLKIENGQVVRKTDEEVLNELKKIKLKELEEKTKTYIEQYYPEIKQRSDISDKEYWSSWLMARNQSYTAQQIYFLVFQSVAKILSGQTTLNAELQNYPEAERVAWEQLIKVGLRIAFVQAVKQEYHQLAQAIKNARTKEELERLQIQFKTRFPL